MVDQKRDLTKPADKFIYVLEPPDVLEHVRAKRRVRDAPRHLPAAKLGFVANEVSQFSVN